MAMPRSVDPSLHPSSGPLPGWPGVDQPRRDGGCLAGEGGGGGDAVGAVLERVGGLGPAAAADVLVALVAPAAAVLRPGRRGPAVRRHPQHPPRRPTRPRRRDPRRLAHPTLAVRPHDDPASPAPADERFPVWRGGLLGLAVDVLGAVPFLLLAVHGAACLYVGLAGTGPAGPDPGAGQVHRPRRQAQAPPAARRHGRRPRASSPVPRRCPRERRHSRCAHRPARRHAWRHRRVREFIAPSPYDPHLTYDEAGELLGTGPGLPRQLVADGLVGAIRHGQNVRIPRSSPT